MYSEFKERTVNTLLFLQSIPNLDVMIVATVTAIGIAYTVINSQGDA